MYYAYYYEHSHRAIIRAVINTVIRAVMITVIRAVMIISAELNCI